MNPLWRKQVAALVAFDMRRILFGRRALAVHLLVMLAIVPFVLRLAAKTFRGAEPDGLAETAMKYAAAYQFMILRVVLFLACAWIFMNLFRADVLDRIAHYYLLCPLRRGVLVAGKYLAGVSAAVLLMATLATATLVLMYLPEGALGAGLRLLPSYLAMTVLAVFGYGAVFLLAGLLVRNPLIPIIAVWLLEAANPFMPTALKGLSVVYHVNALAPVVVAEGPLAVIADAPSPWIALPGIALVIVGLLGLATWRLERSEIAYGGD